MEPSVFYLFRTISHSLTFLLGRVLEPTIVQVGDLADHRHVMITDNTNTNQVLNVPHGIKS